MVYIIILPTESTMTFIHHFQLWLHINLALVFTLTDHTLYSDMESVNLGRLTNTCEAFIYFQRAEGLLTCDTAGARGITDKIHQEKK